MALFEPTLGTRLYVIFLFHCMLFLIFIGVVVVFYDSFGRNCEQATNDISRNDCLKNTASAQAKNYTGRNSLLLTNCTRLATNRLRNSSSSASNTLPFGKLSTTTKSHKWFCNHESLFQAVGLVFLLIPIVACVLKMFTAVTTARREAAESAALNKVTYRSDAVQGTPPRTDSFSKSRFSDRLSMVLGVTRMSPRPQSPLSSPFTGSGCGVCTDSAYYSVQSPDTSFDENPAFRVYQKLSTTEHQSPCQIDGTINRMATSLVPTYPDLVPGNDVIYHEHLDKILKSTNV